MKIGIICASDSELVPFLPLIQDCVLSEKAMLKFYSGTMSGIQVVTLFSGVCRTNAAIATQILIDTYHCDTIINAGTAGGMVPHIQLFDTIVSTECAYWDVAEDILTEFHPWAKSIFWKSDQMLINAAKRTISKNDLKNIYFGRMVTGEKFIDQECRDEINEKLAPFSVDMETAGIAHTCYVNHIPFLSVRTITDTEEQSGTDNFEQNCERASEIAAHFVSLLIGELKSCTK